MYQYFPVLGQRRRQQAGTLSGGEQQMLAVARALMSRPRLLLLDEPSLGLAPLLMREIFRIVRAINQDEGVTVLLVEQNAAMALELADHAYLLETGRVVMSGPSADSAARRLDPPLLPRLLKSARGHLDPAGVSGLADGRHLREPRAGARHDLPGDGRGELRPGRHGDVQHLPLLVAAAARACPTGSPSSPPSSSPSWAALLIERIVIRPVEDAPILTIVIVTLGLVVHLHQRGGLDLLLHPEALPEPVPERALKFGNIVFGAHDLGAIGVTLVVLLLLFLFFRYTHAGPRHAGGGPEPDVEPARAASAWAGCSRSAGDWPRPSARWRA